MSLTLHKKAFSELTTQELYDLLRIRNEVFVVEQAFHPFLDQSKTGRLVKEQL